MRIGSYNMLCFEGLPAEEAAAVLGDMHDERRITHFASVIQSLECDILGIQEGQSVEHMRKIAHTLGVGTNLAAFPSATRYCGGIFTRFPILESRTFSHCGLSAREAAYSRFGGAALLDADGRRMWVVDIHTHPHKEELRQQEAAILGRQLDAMLADGYDMAIMGDFNSRVGSVLHDTVRMRGFVNAQEHCGFVPTLDKEGKPRLPIDHIYLTPGLAEHLKDAHFITGPGFRFQGPRQPGEWVNSDHAPIVADLEL